MRKMSTTGKVVHSDLMHGLDQNLDNLSTAERCRWWSAAAQRWREYAEKMYPGLFLQMEDGEIEHSACEFVRMCRKLFKIDDRNKQLMLPTILRTFEEMEFNEVSDEEG